VVHDFVFHFVCVDISSYFSSSSSLLLFDVVCFVSASFIENPVVPSLPSSSMHASVTNPVTQSRRRRGRRSTRNTSPTHVPILTKRTSLQTKTPLSGHNRELAFRQLTEQLWAAGIPSQTMASSMSVRSRCSSAPPSERGGGDDEMIKIDWNNGYDDEEENIIDWDEPDKPDEGNSKTKIDISLHSIILHARTHTCLLLT
jgi:hypothetical protein